MVSFGSPTAKLMCCEQHPSITYSVNRLGITNIADRYHPYTDQIAVAVRHDWPVLSGILNKGLATITEDERTELYR